MRGEFIVAEEIPEGMCMFEGRLIRITETPERAWPLPMYSHPGAPTGETIGDVVRKARERENAGCVIGKSPTR